MAGNHKGGKQAALTNRTRYGHNFYETIGALGGKKSRGGGFAKYPELARIAGRKGGMASRRKSSRKNSPMTA